jgi:hypothetical protein
MIENELENDWEDTGALAGPGLTMVSFRCIYFAQENRALPNWFGSTYRETLTFWSSIAINDFS